MNDDIKNAFEHLRHKLMFKRISLKYIDLVNF